MRRLFRFDGLNPRAPLAPRLLLLLRPDAWWVAACCIAAIVGVLGALYVFGAWMLYFARPDAWWWSVAMGVFALAVVTGAIYRVPIALVILGGAVSAAISVSPSVLMGLLP